MMRLPRFGRAFDGGGCSCGGGGGSAVVGLTSDGVGGCVPPLSLEPAGLFGKAMRWTFNK